MRDLEMSWVYAITNTVTGQCCYIGSTVNYTLRISQHKQSLRKGTHSNYRLQAAWREYGEDAFSFSVLERTDVDSLRRRELWHMRQHPEAYNIIDGNYRAWLVTRPPYVSPPEVEGMLSFAEFRAAVGAHPEAYIRKALDALEMRPLRHRRTYYSPDWISPVREWIRAWLIAEAERTADEYEGVTR